MSYEADPHNLAQRVLLVTPTRRAGELTSASSGRPAAACPGCRDPKHRARELDAGAGAVRMTERPGTAGGIGDRIGPRNRRPPWSDLPSVLLTRGGATTPGAAAETLGLLRNVTLLE